MNFFELPGLPDCLLLTITALIIIGITSQERLNIWQKYLYAGITCVLTGILSVIAEINPQASGIVFLIIGGLCVGFSSAFLYLSWIRKEASLTNLNAEYVAIPIQARMVTSYSETKCSNQLLTASNQHQLKGDHN